MAEIAKDGKKRSGSEEKIIARHFSGSAPITG